MFSNQVPLSASCSLVNASSKNSYNFASSLHVFIPQAPNFVSIFFLPETFQKLGPDENDRLLPSRIYRIKLIHDFLLPILNLNLFGFQLRRRSESQKNFAFHGTFTSRSAQDSKKFEKQRKKESFEFMPQSFKINLS